MRPILATHPILALVAGLSAVAASLPQKPILTDEFDRFLVTADTEIGQSLGRVELVFPNEKQITWSLVPPVPYADRRNYLQPGQLDATEIVQIDPDTGEITLKAHPESYPAHYYAETRAENEDGSMKAVLLVIALEETPTRDDALDIFTQRVETPGVTFWATERVDPKKVEYAANVANTLLMKDQQGSGRITEFVKQRNAIMTLFYTFEERNTSIGFYMHRRALGLRTQDLEDEEIIPDYLRLGGPQGVRRDASVEEITHLIHRGGIMPAYPELQERLERATYAAIERGFYRPQDGLPEDSFADEYLAYGLDIFYGAHQRRSFDGVPLTPESLETLDPDLHEILSFLFPSCEEFFRAMGWEDDLESTCSGTRSQRIELPEIDTSGSANGIVPIPDDAPAVFREVFTKYTKLIAPNGKPIHFLAQDGWSDARILKARNVMQHVLTDVPGSRYGADKSVIADSMADRRATMVLFNTEPDLRAAFESTDLRYADLSMQDLRANECPVEGDEDYLAHRTRDASFEEIIHLVHDYGIKPALPEMQDALRRIDAEATARGIWRGWPDDEVENHPNEYIGVLYDNYLDLWTVLPTVYEGRPIEDDDIPDGHTHFGRYGARGRDGLRDIDPQGLAIVQEFFPPFLTYEPELPSEFDGAFSLTRDASLRYTTKSQHLKDVSLSGANDAGLIGNGWDNALTGNAGDNSIDGRGGNDLLVGGGGADEAVYRGAADDYQVLRRDGGVVTVVDGRIDRDGVDTLVGIERLRFSDRVIDLD